MTKTLRNLRTTVFAGSVGAALVFGAASLRADVRPGAACSDLGGVAACTTTIQERQCPKLCRGVYGAGTGACSAGCCYCIWF